MPDITHPLVEETRPPIYTAMKYWGKKPHNIWRQYIAAYTPPDGVVLDPFCGSMISALEAVRAGRRAIAFDLNPLSEFFLETYTSRFDAKALQGAVDGILAEVGEDETYLKMFTTKVDGAERRVVCYKWDGGKMYEVGAEEIVPPHTRGSPKRFLKTPDAEDESKARAMAEMDIPYWHPEGRFPSSCSAAFIDCIGGDSFAYLWTRRNLFVLAKIFSLILAHPGANVKQQLLSGFVQTVHLCSRMCVPRNPGANRAFSTSWGRSAYLCASRQMEMNPLHVFKSSCLGKQSVQSCLEGARDYFNKAPVIARVGESARKKQLTGGFDIKYGAVDVNNLEDYVPADSVDFVMTDPPYGGLVQYLDLSLVWLCWLQRYDARFKPNHNSEITIKDDNITFDEYSRRFTGAMRQIFRILKKDATAVFTFHNKEIGIWNAFLRAIGDSGFEVRRVIHQVNRRSGESAVSNPYGTSASDFYIQCVKRKKAVSAGGRNYADFVVASAIRLLAERQEPTPFQILHDGLLAEVSQHGYLLSALERRIEDVLKSKIGEVFVCEKTGQGAQKAGDLWYLASPDKHIQYPDLPLQNRVEEVIIALLRRKTSVTFDEVLGEIYTHFINGLTPDVRQLMPLLNKYAIRSAGRWKSNLAANGEAGEHTRQLSLLARTGKDMGFKVFVGKREQPERLGGNKRLKDLADFTALPKLLDTGKQEAVKRLEMVDMLWLQEAAGNAYSIAAALEVENSTDFVAAINRASNAGNAPEKYMVIPEAREQELRGIRDPAFVRLWKEYNWAYLTYADVERISTRKNRKGELLAKLKKGAAGG